MEINPRVVFERMFGGTGTVERAARAHAARAAASSTRCRSRPRKLQQGLGARDQSRLSEYLDNVREIERRIERAEQQTGADLKVPEAPIGVPGGVRGARRR